MDRPVSTAVSQGQKVQQDLGLGQPLTAVPPLELRHRAEGGQDREDLGVEGRPRQRQQVNMKLSGV